jgi:hypothetical protein
MATGMYGAVCPGPGCGGSAGGADGGGTGGGVGGSVNVQPGWMSAGLDSVRPSGKV